MKIRNFLKQQQLTILIALFIVSVLALSAPSKATSPGDSADPKPPIKTINNNKVLSKSAEKKDPATESQPEYTYDSTPNEQDPWEKLNRSIFKFNDAIVDEIFLRPTAQVYKSFTPLRMRQCVQNFFSNLEEVITIPNDLLQGKIKQAGNDSSRLIINSTLGMLGLFDFATELGFEKHSEDFGQTFGYWGIPDGPYLVLPFLGPSTIRDTVGLIPEHYIEPTQQISEDEARIALTALEVIALRAEFLESDSIVKGDKYVFFREAYLQRRSYLINDGLTEDDPFLDDEDW